MILGFGINDTLEDSNRKISKNYKIYNTWKAMIERCYSEKYQIKNPSYVGSVVCEEWKYYSNFKKWYLQNYQKGYELDKDIIGGNKKVYSPDTCAFVPKMLNYCILEGNKNKNNPLGVSYHKKSKSMVNERKNPYDATICKFQKITNIGSFSNPYDAHCAWQLEKIRYFEELIEIYKNDVIPGVIDGLQRRINIIRDDIDNKRITTTINKI